MRKEDTEQWTKIRQAQQQLVSQFLEHQDVTMIDIGFLQQGAQNSGQMALRIHVRQDWFDRPPTQRTLFPDDVNGIPVVILSSPDYKPES